MFENINNAVIAIKKQKPLIVNITNDVTTDFIANGLLSLGASPVMSKSQEEIVDLIAIAKVLVINLGTLNAGFMQLAQVACESANQLKKPIILDPVGAGASAYRTQSALTLLHKFDIAVLRGNAGEIMALAGVTCQTKGVDSVAESDAALESAKIISKQFNTTVVVSGAKDLVVQGKKIETFTYGSPLMPQITGTGCLLTAVVGAFHAVEPDAFGAAILATVFYGKAGERAAVTTTAPASFKVAFLDALYGIN